MHIDVIHDSALRHTVGEAVYIDDMPSSPNLLHGALVTSRIALGKIKKINCRKLKKLPFYTKVIIAKDIPGQNDIGPIKAGEPMLAEDIVSYWGQPIAIVLAPTYQEAIHASGLVDVEIDETEKPILSVDEAYKKKIVFR